MFEKYHLLRYDYEDKYLSLSVDSFNLWEVSQGAVNTPESQVNLHGTEYANPIRPMTDYGRSNLYQMISFEYGYGLSGFQTRSMILRYYLLFYTISGEGKLEYEGKTYLLKAGDVFIIDRSKLHSFYSVSECWEHVQIHYTGGHSAYLYEQIQATGSHVFSMENPSKYLSAIETLLNHSERTLLYRELLVSNQLEKLLLMTLSRSTASKNKLEQLPDNLMHLVRHMERHYMEGLSLDDLSRISNISKYHMCRVFKESIGFSPKEYLIRLQIENAKNLLLTTNLSASEIGEQVGIQDETYFYRIFRKKTGMSPGAYRRTAGEPINTRENEPD